jgi:hypothetical protein
MNVPKISAMFLIFLLLLPSIGFGYVTVSLPNRNETLVPPNTLLNPPQKNETSLPNFPLPQASHQASQSSGAKICFDRSKFIYSIIGIIVVIILVVFIVRRLLWM